MSGMNERALSLLRKLGLEYRVAYADDTAALEKALASPIDWERVDAARVKNVEAAWRFSAIVCRRAWENGIILGREVEHPKRY